MAQVPSYNDNGGFTLVEVLIAILIMMVGMIGVLQSLNVAMEHNLRNQMRDQGVHVGEMVLNEMRGQDFDAAFTNETTIPMNIRGIPSRYTVERDVTELGADTKQYDVTVKWTYKGRPFQNKVVTVRSKIHQ